jgi:hypothetical protein
MPTTIINVAASGTNHIVPAASVPSGFCIRVTAFWVSISGTVNCKFQSSGGSDLTGLFYGTANKDWYGGPTGLQQRGLFQTLVNEGLDVNLSGAIAVGGYVNYELVGQ